MQWFRYTLGQCRVTEMGILPLYREYPNRIPKPQRKKVLTCSLFWYIFTESEPPGSGFVKYPVWDNNLELFIPVERHTPFERASGRDKKLFLFRFL